MSVQFLTFDDEVSWTRAWVEYFLSALKEASLRGSRAFHAALPGGSTPWPLYRALASALRDIEALCGIETLRDIEIHFWVEDERDVPLGEPGRNGAMIERAFSRAKEWKIPPEIHLWPDLPREPAMSRFEKEIRDIMGFNPIFDLVALGAGEDGHTAGIFESRDAIGSGEGLVLATTAPEEPRRRMTMSASLLRQAHRKVVLASGARKLPVLLPLREPEFRASPLSLVVDGNATILFLDVNR